MSLVIGLQQFWKSPYFLVSAAHAADVVFGWPLLAPPMLSPMERVMAVRMAAVPAEAPRPPRIAFCGPSLASITSICAFMNQGFAAANQGGDEARTIANGVV